MRFTGVLTAGLLLILSSNAIASAAPGVRPVQEKKEEKKQDQKKDEKSEEKKDEPSEEAPKTPVLDAVREVATKYQDQMERYRTNVMKPSFRKGLVKARKEGPEAYEAFLKEQGKPDRKAIANLVKEMEQVAAYSVAFLAIGGERRERADAMEYLLDNHADSEAVSLVMDSVSSGVSAEVAELRYRKIMTKNPSKRLKAIATYSLGRLLADRRPEEAEKLLDKVIEKYASVESGGKTLGEAAEAALFPIRYLRVGAIAPDIEGEDIDGVEFKLSDYRGKVVLLDFWGDW